MSCERAIEVTEGLTVLAIARYQPGACIPPLYDVLQ